MYKRINRIRATISWRLIFKSKHMLIKLSHISTHIYSSPRNALQLDFIHQCLHNFTKTEIRKEEDDSNGWMDFIKTLQSILKHSFKCLTCLTSTHHVMKPWIFFGVKSCLYFQMQCFTYICYNTFHFNNLLPVIYLYFHFHE